MWKWLLGGFGLLALLCGGGGFFVTATDQGKAMMKQMRPPEKQTEVRIDTVNHLGPFRLNVWTAIMVFTLAVAYFLRSRHGAKSAGPKSLGGDHERDPRLDASSS